MPFRRRRLAPHRLAIIAVALLTYLVSALPAAASVVYCIGDDGHEGFELVAGNERGCASCCHDERETTSHEGEAGVVECTDISLSSDQAFRAAASPDRDNVAAFTPLVAIAVALPDSIVAAVRESSRTTLDPPRSTGPVLLSHTVLLI